MIAAALAAVTLAAPTHAADPVAVRLVQPGPLMSGLGNAPDVRGTWYQMPTVTDHQLVADVTLQLPAVKGTRAPGLVVILWQLVVGVTDAQSGDSTQAATGPPRTTAVLPHCDAAGNCALRVQLSGPIAPALEAADLSSVVNPTLAVWLSAVRTFNDGEVVQVADPHVAAGGDSGTLEDPGDSYGALNLSPAFLLADAFPLDVPGDRFGHAGDLFDWATAVRSALGNLDPTASAEPIPINVWDPQRTGLRHLRLRATFNSPCPADRVVVVESIPSKAVAGVIYVGGTRILEADLAVDSGTDWLVALRMTGGETVSTTRVPADEAGALVSGIQDCATGKGLLQVSALPTTVPNPTTMPSASSPPQAHDPTTASAAILIALSLGVVVIGLAASFRFRRGTR